MENLGQALTSQKIVPGDTATSIGTEVCTYIERVITFTSGGTGTIANGDVVKGATSAAVAIVCSTPVLTSGTFAGGNAAGSFRVKACNGTWTANENLTIGATADAATMTGTPVNRNDSYLFKGAQAKAVMINVLNNEALMTIDGSTPDQTYLLGTSILPADEELYLFDPNEIRNAKFIDYTSGSASTIQVTCYF